MIKDHDLQRPKRFFGVQYPRTMIQRSTLAVSILTFFSISVQRAAIFIYVNQYINTRPIGSQTDQLQKYVSCFYC